MKQIEFELESISPMKMDRWIDEKQPKSEEGYKKQAELKVYKDEKGNLSVPASAIKACMRFASSEIGKKMEAKKNRQTIKSAVFIEPEFLSIGKKKHDGIVRDIATRGQGEKVTRVPVYRPLVKKWSCKGKINTFDVPEDFLKECLQLAGIRYGVLSHRPEFGRFVIKSWKVIGGNGNGK